MCPSEGVGRAVIVGQRIAVCIIRYRCTVVCGELVSPVAVAVGVSLCTLYAAEGACRVGIRLLACYVAGGVVRVSISLTELCVVLTCQAVEGIVGKACDKGIGRCIAYLGYVTTLIVSKRVTDSVTVYTRRIGLYKRCGVAVYRGVGIGLALGGSPTIRDCRGGYTRLAVASACFVILTS